MRWKTLLLLAVAVGLVLFIVFYERKLPTTDERRETALKVFPFQDGDFTALDLTDGELRWTLRKEDGKWRLKAPLQYPADDLAVSGIISALVTLRKEKTLEPGADFKGLGLEPVGAVLKIETAAGRATLALGADIPGTGRMAVRWVERGEAYFVGGSLRATVRKSVDELRDKAIFTVDTAAVARMELIYPASGKTAALWKEAAGWKIDFPFTDLADPDGVDKLLYTFSGLRAKAFIDDPQARGGLQTLGLDPPTTRIAFYDKDKKSLLEAAVGRVPGLAPDEFYLQRGAQVFLVSSDLWSGLQQGVLTIPNPKLLAVSRWEVERLEAKTPERTLTLKRSDDGGWTLGGKALTDTNPVYNLLDRLTAVKWMENYQKPSLGSEVLQIAIATDQSQTDVVFRADAKEDGAVWATVSGRMHYWKIEKEVLDGVLKAIAEIR